MQDPATVLGPVFRIFQPRTMDEDDDDDIDDEDSEDEGDDEEDE